MLRAPLTTAFLAAARRVGRGATVFKTCDHLWIATYSIRGWWIEECPKCLARRIVE